MKMEVLGTTKVYNGTIEEHSINCATHKRKDKEELIDDSVDKKRTVAIVVSQGMFSSIQIF